MKLQIWLVRHGRTIFNTVGRLQGSSDSPLTPEGIDDIRRFGRDLAPQVSFDRAFCTTAPRTQETARHLLEARGQPELRATPIAALREYDFGGWEGERMQTVYEIFAERNGMPGAESWLHAYRTGTGRNLMIENIHATDPLKLAETEAQFTTRVRQGMDQLVSESRAGEQVLLVCHGMTITAMLKSIDPTRVPYHSIRHAFAVRLNVENGKWLLPEQEILHA